MNVVSLFDGASCGQIALNRIGIKPDKYFASEIHKPSIQITQKNFPETIQIGDINFVTEETFKNVKVGLVIGGSPCQSFSNAGDGTGFDGKSGLFWEYIRVLKMFQKIDPDVKFLLENVNMKKEWQDVISKALNVEPVKINSRILSAQNRPRLYWTNINIKELPEESPQKVADILQKDEEVENKFMLS